MDIKTITHQTETDFLKIVIRQLKSGKMSLDQAKIIAKEFLALLPFEDEKSLEEKLKPFTDKYIDFKPLYISILKDEEEKQVSDLLSKMREYMKDDKIDEALELVK